MWFSVVCTLIDNDTRHHSGQNVVDSRGAANTTTLIDNGKLANQIARLVAIVVKILIELSSSENI